MRELVSHVGSPVGVPESRSSAGAGSSSSRVNTGSGGEVVVEPEEHGSTYRSAQRSVASPLRRILESAVPGSSESV